MRKKIISVVCFVFGGFLYHWISSDYAPILFFELNYTQFFLIYKNET